MTVAVSLEVKFVIMLPTDIQSIILVYVVTHNYALTVQHNTQEVSLE